MIDAPRLGPILHGPCRLNSRISTMRVCGNGQCHLCDPDHAQGAHSPWAQSLAAFRLQHYLGRVCIPGACTTVEYVQFLGPVAAVCTDVACVGPGSCVVCCGVAVGCTAAPVDRTTNTMESCFVRDRSEY